MRVDGRAPTGPGRLRGDDRRGEPVPGRGARAGEMIGAVSAPARRRGAGRREDRLGEVAPSRSGSRAGRRRRAGGRARRRAAASS